MKIHVLNFTNPKHMSKVTRTDLKYLRQSAEKLGHEIELIHIADCQFKFDKKPQVLIKNKEPKDINIILVRANFLSADIEFKTFIIKQFTLNGYKVVNNHLAVARAKNKLRTMQILASNKVPIPKTYLVTSSEYIDDVVKDIGNFPVILKTAIGSHGSGVSIIESKKSLRSVMEMFMVSSQSTPLMVQEYIKESKGKDLRVFIVGRRIIGAMDRIAQKRGEFRSNFHLGGRVKVASMTREEKDVAFAAVRALGLDMAGVDIIRTNSGPKVLEVNANPGLEGITKATGRDVAGEIIKFTVRRARRKKSKKKLKKAKTTNGKVLKKKKISK